MKFKKKELEETNPTILNPQTHQNPTKRVLEIG